jgi:hypothetical protein
MRVEFESERTIDLNRVLNRRVIFVGAAGHPCKTKLVHD